MRTLNLDLNLAFHGGFCTAEEYIPATYWAITPTLVMNVTTQAQSKVEKKGILTTRQMQDYSTGKGK